MDGPDEPFLASDGVAVVRRRAATAIRLGVLGCADIALRRVLPAVAGLADLTLSAVASRSPAKAAAVADDFGCSAVTGYGELLDRDDVDAVYIPLPIAMHERWVEAALRAGKHVLAEKPMTTSRRRTEDLLALARARGLALMENVMFVHHSQHAAVRRLVEDGAIGEARLFQASFLIPRCPGGSIRDRADLGGGALRELGIYPVRAALYHLSGVEVVAALRTPTTGALDTGGVALLRAHPDVAVQLTYGIDHSYRSCYQIVGSAGRISVDRAFTPSADHHPRLRIANRAGAEEVRVLAPDDQVANVLNAFVASVRAGASPISMEQVVQQAGLLDELSTRVLPGAAGEGTA